MKTSWGSAAVRSPHSRVEFKTADTRAILDVCHAVRISLTACPNAPRSLPGHEALPRLHKQEGYAFEKLIRKLHQEVSRKGLGDFEMSEIKLGYWNRPRDVAKQIEIDLVALDEVSKIIRFGSCKRSASAHDSAELARFD